MEAMKKPNGKYKEEVINRSLRLYENGMKSETVEAITDMKRRSVNYHANKQGIQRSFGNTALTPREAKDVKDLYVDCKLSSNQVAELLSIPSRKVRRFLAREGLMRSRIEALRLRFKRRSNYRNQR
tara:strand:- start:45 stop:422 length:378 start_codon:yes stop_codon:yes gene_type:complete